MFFGMSDVEQIFVEANKRTAFGKKNRALRRSGKTPINVYGGGHESCALEVDSTDLLGAVRLAGRTKSMVVRFDGSDVQTMIRDVALHPVSGTMLHVDLMRVTDSTTTVTAVPIRLNGVSEAPVTRGSGFGVVQILHHVNMTAKVGLLPEMIEVDCSKLADPSDKISIDDLTLPKGVKAVDDGKLQIVVVKKSRAARAAADEGEEGQTADDAPAPTDGDDAEKGDKDES